eukprot:scaffold1875_cov77-Skeletonema_marinoi.AAC.6
MATFQRWVLRVELVWWGERKVGDGRVGSLMRKLGGWKKGMERGGEERDVGGPTRKEARDFVAFHAWHSRCTAREREMRRHFGVRKENVVGREARYSKQCVVEKMMMTRAK